MNIFVGFFRLVCSIKPSWKNGLFKKVWGESAERAVLGGTRDQTLGARGLMPSSPHQGILFSML